jgi:hypothetical protein
LRRQRTRNTEAATRPFDLVKFPAQNSWLDRSRLATHWM